MPQDSKPARVVKVYTLEDIERLDRRIERLIKYIRWGTYALSIIGCIGFGSLIPQGVPMWQRVCFALSISVVMTILFPRLVEAWMSYRVSRRARKTCPPQK